MEWKWVALANGLLFVVALFVGDTVRTLVRKAAAATVRSLERSFSGSRWVRARALRRYRRHVANRLASVPVPFQLPVDIPLRDVYIPLRAADQPEITAAENPVDLSAAVTANRRALVLGPPGSGKSLFLHYLHWSACAHPSETAETNGRRRNGDTSTLAVPVALSELAKSGDVEAEITTSFARHEFPNAADLVRRELRRPTPDLLVLFDGLDEVASQKRADVAKLVVDFSRKHPDVRFVVTCRTQVYEGALDGVVDAVFHVQPFTDELVERFLRAWPAMSSPLAVDRLVNALRDTPRVAAMVRNPLLLTLLAYLYSTEYREAIALLPHNRTHFYRDVSTLLLQRWRGELNLNRYRWEAKKVVLQHLALAYQDSQSDRRGMRYEEVLAEVRQALPRVDIATSDAPEVLDEIVERSGLLVRLDAGERYQFAHLTMQEYFAAVELADQPDEILRRYRADPDAWREPLKLWCGGEQDATDVLRALDPTERSIDGFMALECLADATRVDPSYAERLVGWAQRYFTSNVMVPDRLSRAIGILASDRRPRGQAMLQFMLELHQGIRRGSGLPGRGVDGRAVAVALAASNLPEAARALVELTILDPEVVRPSLVSMGNVAVPALEQFVAERSRAPDKAALKALLAEQTLDEAPPDEAFTARDLLKAALEELLAERALAEAEMDKLLAAERRRWNEVLSAVDCLAAIGTPRAAEALARLLWFAAPSRSTPAPPYLRRSMSDAGSPSDGPSSFSQRSLSQ